MRRATHTFKNVLIDTLISQRLQRIPVEGAFACTWRATEHDYVLRVALGEGHRLGIVRVLICQIFEGVEDPLICLGRFVQEKLFRRLESDANVCGQISISVSVVIRHKSIYTDRSDEEKSFGLVAVFARPDASPTKKDASRSTAPGVSKS